MEFPILVALIVCSAFSSSDAGCDSESSANKACISALVDYCVTQPAALDLRSKCSADCFRAHCGSGQRRSTCCSWYLSRCGSRDGGFGPCGTKSRAQCLDYRTRFTCPATCHVCPTPTKSRLTGVRFINVDNVVKIIYL